MRIERRQSETDIYHVIQRGTGRQLIFEDDEDRWRLLQLLEMGLEASHVLLHAWCLMGNHVHLLPQAPLEALSVCMRDVFGRYALGFNVRHGRTGHLCQERYKSQPVADERYLLTTVCYIHQNPEIVGLCATSDWCWSSYREYLAVEGAGGLCEAMFVLDGYGGVEGFVEAHRVLCEDGSCTEVFGKRNTTRAMPDGDALDLANRILGSDAIENLKGKSRLERDEDFARFKSAGLSVRQKERLTGIGRNTIGRIKPEERIGNK